MNTGYSVKCRRLTAFLLAVVLSLLPVISVEFGSFTSWADGGGRGETYTYYGTQNLLKDGASFPFYGKEHNRVGLWPYGITNASDSGGNAPGYCLESNKSMRKASFTIFTISQNICSCKEVFSFYFLKLLPKRINLPRRKLLGKALLYQNQGFQVGSDLVQHCSGLKFLTGLGKRSGLIKFSHFR